MKKINKKKVKNLVMFDGQKIDCGCIGIHSHGEVTWKEWKDAIKYVEENYFYDLNDEEMFGNKG